jgi:hypothetical protein
MEQYSMITTAEAKERARIARSIRPGLCSGFQNGTALADFLNYAGEMPILDPERHRSTVLDAVCLLRRMNEGHATGEPARFYQTMTAEEAKKAKKTSIGEAEAQLLRILGELQPMRWTVEPSGCGYVIGQEPPTTLERAFMYLGAVTEADMLDYLRQCKRPACQKWLMAHRRDMDFCSKDCQQKYWAEYRKTREGLDEQAERMRRFRAKKKQSKSKSKRRRKR